VITALKVIGLYVQFHDQRQRWRYNHSTAVVRGCHYASADQKRRKRRDNLHSVHFYSPEWRRSGSMITSPAPAGAGNLHASRISMREVSAPVRDRSVR